MGKEEAQQQPGAQPLLCEPPLSCSSWLPPWPVPRLARCCGALPPLRLTLVLRGARMPARRWQAEKVLWTQILGNPQSQDSPGPGAQPFSVWASFVSLRFLLWQVCQIPVTLKPTALMEQWPPVTINYHRPVTFENIARPAASALATCALQLSKHGVTRTGPGQPGVALSSSPSTADP